MVNVKEGKCTLKMLNLSDKKVEFKVSMLNKLNIEKYNEDQFNCLTLNKNNNKNIYNIDRNTLIRENLKLNHLNKTNKDKIENLCLDFSDIFFVEGDPLKKTQIIEHSIDLDTDKTIFTKQYPIPQAYKEEINKQVKDMLEADIIEESLSPYNSPIILVKKKSEDNNPKFRFVIDLRNINEHIVPIFYNLPLLNDMFNQVTNASFFSKLDLTQGYFQIGVKPEDCKKLAFTSPMGRFQFKRVPFGLYSSSFIFQKMMSMVLKEIESESI
jgi:hypothetical protein